MSIWNRLFGGGASTPENPFEPMDLSETRTRAGHAEPAVAYVDPQMRLPGLQTLAETAPTDPVMLAALGGAQLALGEFDEGLATWNRALFHEKDRERVLRANRVKGTTLDLYLNHPDKGVEHYQACLDIDPHWIPARVLMAELALRRGDERELERLLKSFLKQGAKGALADVEAALHEHDHEAATTAIQVANMVELLQCIRAVTGD